MNKVKNERNSRPGESRYARLTIGLMINNPEEAFHAHLWPGVADVAQERDVNLVCLVGGILRSPALSDDLFYDNFEYQRNVIYDLAGPDNLDGLIVLSGSLSNLTGPGYVQDFCERYRPLPMVSVSLAFEGFPSLLVDNESGMREAVAHLIQAHDCHRIAFIQGPEGNPEAEVRYRAYAEVLEAHDLTLDPNLIAPGMFNFDSGTQAISLLMDERGLQPGVDFDAVVSVNDVTAFGAIEALKTRRVRVPGNVAVLGFDDVDQAKFSVPPLTTVQQPVYELGQRAAEMILALIAGEDVPERVVLPTRLVIRHSCGCMDPATTLAMGGAQIEESSTFPLWRQRICATLVRAMNASPGGPDDEWGEQLFEDLSASESPAAFLSALNDFLQRSVTDDVDVVAWQEALSTLPYEGGQGEKTSREEFDLWSRTRLLVAEAANRARAYQQLLFRHQTQVLREVGQQLLSTFELETLVESIAWDLPRLGIPGCYLSLYEGSLGEPSDEKRVKMPEWSRWVLGYAGKKRLESELENSLFISRQLLLEDILPHERRYTMMAEPLYFQDEQLGVVLFEIGPRYGGIYETLRGQLSGALEGVLVLLERKRAEDALHEAYTEVERRVEEQTAELKLEVAERQRAQAESQRLQQEIIEAQKQAIQDLSTPIIPIVDTAQGSIIVMPLIGSIDTMRAKDLMRALLSGIEQYGAKVVILDITGVAVVDSGVASHLNKTIQAARLKGAHTIVTGISDVVAETIVDLGIDWDAIETLADLQTGLRAALARLGQRIVSLPEHSREKSDE